MKVSIVIPNWNGLEKLKRNLPFVIKVKKVDEIIVADDASTDESVQFIKDNYPQIKIVERKTNSGFSGNVNSGVKVAKGDLVFLLNSDAAPEEDCLEFIIPHFKDEKVFSVGCNVGGSWAWGEFKNGYFWHRMSAEKVSEPHQTLWASGGSAIFRKKIWDELEGLDELFNPFYEEDVDLGYRATKRGYKNIFEPRSKVEHYKQVGVIKENFSEQTITKTAQRNQLLFIWKNITSENLFKQHKKALAKMLFSHPKYWSIFLAAYKLKQEIAKKRQIEIKAQKISDEEIFEMYKV